MVLSPAEGARVEMRRGVLAPGVPQERAGRGATTAELQKLVEALQAEKGLLQVQAAQHRAAAARADDARQEAHTAAAALTVHGPSWCWLPLTPQRSVTYLQRARGGWDCLAACRVRSACTPLRITLCISVHVSRTGLAISEMVWCISSAFGGI